MDKTTLFNFGVALAALLAGFFSYQARTQAKMASKNSGETNDAVNNVHLGSGSKPLRIYDLVIRLDERQVQTSATLKEIKDVLHSMDERLQKLEKQSGGTIG